MICRGAMDRKWTTAPAPPRTSPAPPCSWRTRLGQELVIEATTSWAYVGAGLRIQLELLGPEYSMEFNSLSTGLKIFMSREISGEEGEDLVEKQNAEQGLMPVLEDEAGVYGYTDENRHMVECFRRGETPLETFHDGLAVVEMLMALYRSAETGAAVRLPAPELEDYVPAVARPFPQPRRGLSGGASPRAVCRTGVAAARQG